MAIDPKLFVGDISKTKEGEIVTLATGQYRRTPTGYEPVSPTPTPTPTATPSPSPLVLRYQQPSESPLDKAKRELAETQRANSTAPDENSIREQVRQRMQGQVDATNQYYNELASKARAEGDVRNAQTRGINVRAGLMGSDFASANAAGTESKNQDVLKAVEGERQLKLTAIFDKIDQRAIDEIRAKKEEALGNAKGYIDYLSNAQTEARTNIADIAKGGLSLDRVKLEKNANGESIYDQLQRESGMSSLEFDALYNFNLPKKAQKDIKYEKIGNKIVAFTTDAEGNIKTQEYDFDVPAEKKLRVIDGVPYYEDPATQTLTKAGGFTPKGGGGVPGENPQLYSGLSNPTATAVRAKVNAFKTEPTVQNFAVVQEGKNFASSFKTDTTNPADDQALIYALAKALDPGSVVREGEYATAQKYAQSWIKAFGSGVEQAALGTGFLSKTARENIKKTIEQKFESSKKSYDNLYSNYQSGIDNLTGRQDGAKFLTDYQITEEATLDPLVEKAISAGVDPSEVEDLKSQGYSDEQIEALLSS